MQNCVPAIFVSSCDTYFSLRNSWLAIGKHPILYILGIKAPVARCLSKVPSSTRIVADQSFWILK